MSWVWGIVTFLLCALIVPVIADLVSEEARGRLEQLPRALIHLATKRLPCEVRSNVGDEWKAELHYILRGSEALPVTRLVLGVRFSVGLIRVATRIGRDLQVARTKRIISEIFSLITILADAKQNFSNVDEALADARVSNALGSFLGVAVDTPSLKILDNLSDIEEREIVQHGYSQVREIVLHFHPHRSSELPSEITAEMWGEWQRLQNEGQSG